MRKLLFSLAVLLATCQGAQAGERSRFILLGTMAGALPSAERSQPASILVTDDTAILLDVGDGTSGQLARAGIAPGAVRHVFISHHHLDHVGGLFAFLGLRMQANIAEPLAIYGPPGTTALVGELTAALKTSVRHGVVLRQGQDLSRIGSGISVTELADGSRLAIGRVTVSAAANSHYGAARPADAVNSPVSLSFRFDLPDRSLVYTGDTGPSAAVERLAEGADMLVAEILDADEVMKEVVAARPGIDPGILDDVRRHMQEQHLSPRQVGELARRAKVRSIVVTHVGLGRKDIAETKAEIAEAFSGPIFMGKDLDAY